MRKLWRGKGVVQLWLLCCALFLSFPAPSFGQEVPTASTTVHATRVLGTVTALPAGLLTLKPDTGDAVTVSVSAETRVLELPPGSTDLKSAQPGTLSDVSVGDRILVTGVSGTGSAPAAAKRIILMRSSAIAQQRETAQAAWAHSYGGTIGAIDSATGSMTLSSAGRSLTLTTSPATIFRRYAPDSARFEDAKRSSIGDLHQGDQARVRADRVGDALQVQEIVSGSFKQVSGSVVAVDAAGSTVTVRDLHTQQPILITTTARTAVHALPAELAAEFAARSKRPDERKAASPGEQGAAAANAHHREDDLGQVVARLPDLSLASLKPGDAVLLIASGEPTALHAITIVSGVAPLFAAEESGGKETSLAPWSVGGSAEGAGGLSQ